MIKYLMDGEVTVHLGDCLASLKTMESESVNTCVTSPPYYGLRDYGTGTWIGGDPNCPHRRMSKKSDATITGHKNFDAMLGVGDAIYKTTCPLCGAVRVDDQVGLEETPEQYIENLVHVFREVRRVLKDDGTLWLNLGDSYAGSRKGQAQDGMNDLLNKKTKGLKLDIQDLVEIGYKQKDLMGIPWRVAFALQADGWYLRQDIIWHKPNPMPEPVQDRCTKAHEYIFLLSKSQYYYFDAAAIKEESVVDASENRNKRSVWSVPTRAYHGSHFAVFPPDLIEPCILAGCPPGGATLDPFGGSGTTAGVAMKLNRKAILCELNQEYVGIMEQRIQEIVNEKKVEQIDPSQLDFFEELI